MRSPSRDLFQLIKSLSDAEKNYFKRYASRHLPQDKHHCIQLFEIVSRQEEYNEEKIRTLLKNSSIVKHLPVIKHYLHEIILDAMQAYHKNISTSAQLGNLLHQVEFLYGKTLYGHCRKRLVRAKKLAMRQEDFTSLLRIIHLERIIITTLPSPGGYEHLTQHLHREEYAIMEKIKNRNAYQKLKDDLYKHYLRHKTVRNEQEREAYRNLMDTPLCRDENRALSVGAKIDFYSINAFFHYIIGDHINSYRNQKKLIEYMDAHHGQTEGQEKQYLIALNNFSVACKNIKKYDKALETINKLRFWPSKNRDVQIFIFMNCYINELSLYHKTGEFQKGAALIQAMENDFQKHERVISAMHLLTLYDNISHIFFGIGDYYRALLWNNKILNHPKIKIREDAQCLARIFNLIIHYESGDADNLEHRIGSMYRYLYKKQRFYKFEAMVLNFIRKNLSIITVPEELAEAFKELKGKIAEISKDPFESKVLDYFDFISWMESKINNRPFAEIIREKTKVPSA